MMCTNASAGPSHAQRLLFLHEFRFSFRPARKELRVSRPAQAHGCMETGWLSLPRWRFGRHWEVVQGPPWAMRRLCRDRPWRRNFGAIPAPSEVLPSIERKAKTGERVEQGEWLRLSGNPGLPVGLYSRPTGRGVVLGRIGSPLPFPFRLPTTMWLRARPTVCPWRASPTTPTMFRLPSRRRAHQPGERRAGPQCDVSLR